MSQTDQPTDAISEVLHPRGKRYQGQSFDLSSRHSIRIIAPSRQSVPRSQSRIVADDQFAVVDFIYHEGKYWRARIPLDGVEHIYGQAFNFSKPRTRPSEDGPEILRDAQGVPKRKLSCLNHVQSRFVFAENRPVELFALGETMLGEPLERIHDLVYSVEAVGPQGIRFNLRDALIGNLISAHRIMSTREMVFERIVVENMYVLESPQLPLDASKRRAALIASLERSDRASTTETYYLYRVCGTNNCTATPLHVIDQIADYSFPQRLATIFYRFPIRPRLYLRVRGLDSDPRVRKLVRHEFAAYISDPATVQRKRKDVRARMKQLRASRDR